MRKKETITSLRKAKGERKLVMLTAYDALFASLFAESADMLLVGDSLNMTFLGEPDTLSATLEQMIYHTRAVCNGAPESFVVCDMPFGTTNTLDQALEAWKDRSSWATLMQNGMAMDYSWERQFEQYLDLYQRMVGT
jgi:3-methyl-2-oxobutanoate hydroxymethyltransferase